ncbi:MAG: transporter [Proteobacteria bacterium]|nr:transporter [Pseudomonadota bacterium]
MGALAASGGAAASPWELYDGSGAAASPPLGIVGGHTLDAGEWELGYRYFRQRRDGNRDARHRESLGEIRRQGFSFVPLEQDVERHELSLMLAPLERVSLLLTLPVLRLERTSAAANGDRFTQRVAGLGDVELRALVRFQQNRGQTLHLTLGFGLPTGRVDVRGETPRGLERLPYEMQLGSGSYDFLPALTYLGRYQTLSWGGQMSGVYRMTTNRKGYRRRNGYDLSVWFAHRFDARWSASVRMAYRNWNNVRNDDNALDGAFDPSADARRQAGQRVDLGPGVQVSIPGMPKARLLVEALWPVFRDLDGPQLETDWTVQAGWKWGF